MRYEICLFQGCCFIKRARTCSPTAFSDITGGFSVYEARLQEFLELHQQGMASDGALGSVTTYCIQAGMNEGVGGSEGLDPDFFMSNAYLTDALRDLRSLPNDRGLRGSHI